MPRITLYGKPGCHLCDDARAELERLRAELGFELEQVDVSSDSGLHHRYGERIPVVALDGEELSDYFVDVGGLRKRLEGGRPSFRGARGREPPHPIQLRR